MTRKFEGGTRVDAAGYLVIKAGPCRDMRVHILVAEAMLKRKLLPDEDVDHTDGDKLNPEWTNLRVRGKADHGAVSNRQKWFLKHREEHERKQWAEWINDGGVRPDLGKLEFEQDMASEGGSDCNGGLQQAAREIESGESSEMGDTSFTGD